VQKVLMERGIKVFFYHAKIIIADEPAYIGTSNFDKRSFRINDELALFTEDSYFTQQIGQELQKDLQHSEQQSIADIKTANPFIKAKRAAASLISSFL
jgi:cardiolipin synthase A/B